MPWSMVVVRNETVWIGTKKGVILIYRAATRKKIAHCHMHSGIYLPSEPEREREKKKRRDQNRKDKNSSARQIESNVRNDRERQKGCVMWGSVQGHRVRLRSIPFHA